MIREKPECALEAGAARYEHQHTGDEEDEGRAPEEGADEAAGDAD
jgi:hypothetical protein